MNEYPDRQPLMMRYNDEINTSRNMFVVKITIGQKLLAIFNNKIIVTYGKVNTYYILNIRKF